jgi:DNA end-binding protein Ku
VAARIEAAVQRKVEGQEITLTEAPESGGAQVIDLMDALRASLERKAPARSKAPEPVAAARKPPKRAPPAEPAAPAARKVGKNKG